MWSAFAINDLVRFRTGVRRTRRVMEDICGDIIQETGQEQRPARMVGLLSLDSAATGKDASPDLRIPRMRKRGRR
jgi:hypothetical protein